MRHYLEKSVGELMEECGFVKQNKLMQEAEKVQDPVVMPHKEVSFKEEIEYKIRLNK